MLDDVVTSSADNSENGAPTPAVEAAQPALVEQTEPPARPARKRRRPTKAEAAAADQPAAESAPASAAPPALPGDSIEFSDGAVLTRPARTTRPRTRRTTKAAPEPTVAEGTVDTTATSAPEAPAEQATSETPADQQAPVTEVATRPSEADSQPVAEAPARPARRRSSRRKPAQPVEESASATSETVDEVAAAVARELQRAREPRAIATADREKALSTIKAALAGTPEPDSEEETPLVEDAAAETVADTAEESVEEESAEQEAVAEEADLAESAPEDASEEGETGSRRRRRRRGGRRRRRGSEGDDSADREDAESGEESQPGEAGAEDAGADQQPGEDAAEGQSEGSRRRRRRRRRRGEDASAADDDPTDVVVRVREPRPHSGGNDEVTGIEGSTRMEAKRQRRKEGRAAGRARRPILSEAEFLSRREAVVRKLLVRQREEYSQIAVLEDDVLVEHYVDRPSATSLIGNVYLGRVQNVLPSMEAIFIDIGRGRNAVLYAGEVDWDAYGADGQPKKVENVFKSGQMVLVQVTKDPVGAKGARLTSHISLPGRYVVYAPGGHLSGISRKLSDTERHRLRSILSDLVGDEASVIVRTAAEGASEDELVRDVNRLKAQWEALDKKAKQGGGPHQLYTEPDLTVRIVRDLFTEDFSELIISGSGGPDDAYDTIEAYVSHVAPHLLDRVKRWDSQADGDLFAEHRIDEQISKALERKVFLPSGGSLVIDRTEAMTVIDVNTGKFTGTGGNLEATVTSNNLEAAEEIVRQLRLRDIGGIIVVDFIDMVLPSNRELLLRRLVECLGRDRTRHQVAEVTSLGLVQMTRKRIGTGLAEAFTEQCEVCGGRGYVRHDEPVESQAPADGGERHHGRRRSGKH